MRKGVEKVTSGAQGGETGRGGMKEGAGRGGAEGDADGDAEGEGEGDRLEGGEERVTVLAPVEVEGTGWGADAKDEAGVGASSSVLSSFLTAPLGRPLPPPSFRDSRSEGTSRPPAS